jgi:hypothetical protein
MLTCAIWGTTNLVHPRFGRTFHFATAGVWSVLPKVAPASLAENAILTLRLDDLRFGALSIVVSGSVVSPACGGGGWGSGVRVPRRRKA